MDDYFALFQLNRKYQIDLLDLNQRYKKLQMVTHPDKVSLAFKEFAVKQSAVVNAAYDTLRSPVLRAMHLLKLLIETNSAVDDVIQGDVSAFLERQFTLREQLSELALDKIALRDMLHEVESELIRLERDLVHEFDVIAHKSSSIMLLIDEMQFLIKVKEEIDKVLKL